SLHDALPISPRSTPHQRDVVGGRTLTAPHDGHDDPQSDHDLGRGDDEDEEDDRLAADVVEAAGEGDEAEVDGVEHQLDAHEHDQQVAADHQTGRPDREEHGGQHQVPGLGEHQLEGEHQLVTSTSSASADSASADSASAVSSAGPSSSGSTNSERCATAGPSGNSSRSIGSPLGRRDSTTAPTTATVSSTAVTSKAKT